MCYSALVEQDIKILTDKFDSDITIHGFDEYNSWHEQDPKKFKEIAQNPRIYPFYFAAIIARGKQGLVCAPMRYQLWPALYREDPKHLSLFNARLDNLHSPIWGRLFMKQHGLIVIKQFFEWVEVRDLIKAGVVSLHDVKFEFDRQMQQRRQRMETQGKKYQPTKTELTDPMFRKTIISFAPGNAKELYVPVLFDYHRDNGGRDLGSFAIISTDPTEEILRAGHDRRPVFFTRRDQALEFLDLTKSEKVMMDLLNSPPGALFNHQLDLAS